MFFGWSSQLIFQIGNILHGPQGKCHPFRQCVVLWRLRLCKYTLQHGTVHLLCLFDLLERREDLIENSAT